MLPAITVFCVYHPAKYLDGKLGDKATTGLNLGEIEVLASTK
jgi:hypothetical protein